MSSFLTENHRNAKMKSSELIVCITTVLMVVLVVSEASPARKWRPQGRFGKRANEIDNEPLWVLLSSSNNYNGESLSFESGEKPIRLDNLLCLPLDFKNAYKCNRSES
ncbi:uncharacterized protein LOC115209927 [Argonauta hians]